MTQENEQSRFLEYLPAIFHQDLDRPGGSYLGQFLLPFDDVLTGFEDLLSEIDCYFTPARTPPGFLPWLASWVALLLDENWDEAKRRRLIRDAVKLYRGRGTVAGLKDYLKIYDEQIAPDIREWRWPDGMQIGVASQIGGMTPDDVSLARIERVERRPPLYFDYYVVDTVAPAGHPHVPQGEPLKVYYRTDRVKRVDVGGETGAEYVSIRFHTGETYVHHPASVVRRDGLANERYTLTFEGETEPETVLFWGDTFLIKEVELLYRFTVNIRVPCKDWELLFTLPIDLSERTLPEAVWQEFAMRGISFSDDVAVRTEKHGQRWWKIDDEGQSYIVVRKGAELTVYKWVDGKDWEEARQPKNVRTIRTIVDEVKPAHTMYYLKLTPEVREHELQLMRIGVCSTIDVDTTIG